MARTADLELLHEYTATEGLRRHALAVEAAVRAYARKFGADEELWGSVGLLHDFDYERFPEFPDHPMRGSEILKEKGYSEEVRTAILSHVPQTNIPRTTKLMQTLFACDELCGFIMAAAMVRPNKLADLEASSVKKKMKDKAFARAVSREEIVHGAEALGIPLDEHITFVIGALRGISGELGL